MKNAEFTKIVLVNALNDFNAEIVLAEISKFCSHFGPVNRTVVDTRNTMFCYPYYEAVFDTSRFPQLKNSEKYMFIHCPRNSEIFLDFAKVADLLLNISTVEHVNIPRLNIKPSDSVNAIDEIGENMINLLRGQGYLKTLNAVVGWEKIQQNKHKDVKFYFKRLFEEDFPESKTHFLQQETDVVKLLMDLQNLYPFHFEWRKERGYFLVDKLELTTEVDQPKKVYLSGHLKNNLTVEELVHITGIGDFKIDSITGILSNSHDSFMLMKPAVSHHPLDLFSADPSNIVKETKTKTQADGMQEEDVDYHNELEELNKDLGQLNFMQEPKNEAIVEDNDAESFDENDDVVELPLSKKHQKVIKERTTEEKEFEEEVEYNADVKLRERYKMYRHLTSFIDNEWNKYVI